MSLRSVAIAYALLRDCRVAPYTQAAPLLAMT